MSVSMIEAVIFDMDGLLIDSEGFWKEAEKCVFSNVGVSVTEDLSSKTASMTTRKVTEFWFSHSPWENRAIYQVESEVIENVGRLIEKSGVAMKGVEYILNYFRAKNITIGLATNSPECLIEIVLSKLGIGDFFDITISADFVGKGKPAPGIYLSAAEKLGVPPENCLAFEDSLSGMYSALNANMKVVTVPALIDYNEVLFDAADLKLRSLSYFSDDHFDVLNHKLSA